MERFEVSERDLQQDEFDPHRRQPKEGALLSGPWAPQRRPRPAFAGERSTDSSAPVNFIRAAGLKETAPEEVDVGDEEDRGEDGPEEPPTEVAPQKKRKTTGGPSPPSRQARFAGGGRTESLGGFGSWERHTRGIGRKLLRKMGHVPGRGLGKDAQGILRPIEATRRRGKGGVGADGSERASQPLRGFFPGADSWEEAAEEFQTKERSSRWRKDPRGGKKEKKQPRWSYQTAEGLEAKGGGPKQLWAPQEGLAQVKVIDMTGREQKIYSSYSQVSQRPNIPAGPPPQQQQLLLLDQDSSSEPPQAFALPELEHNLQLLLDLTEQELIQSDRQLQSERHVVVRLSREIEEMGDVLSRGELEVLHLSQALQRVEEGERRTRPGCEKPPSLLECAQIFATLRDTYYEEYLPSDRVDLAAAVVFPLVKEHFKTWDATSGLEVLGQGKKGLLESDQLWSPGGQEDPSWDAFHRLVWEAWRPHLRNVVGQWQPRNYVPMVDLLASWGRSIPAWILDHILDQLIFPKLQEEVEIWDPLADPVPVHSWLHPWLPLMRARLEPLYPPIRRKLSRALQKWHPRDPSAKRALQPWKDVFAPGPWEAFVLQNIVPKLGLCLDELLICPHPQHHVGAFFWALDWEGLIPPSCLVGLLERHFFPRWLQALCSWLSNGPDYEEVSKWYLGWKARFSDQLLAHPSVKEKFKEALDVMNRAASSSVGGYLQPGAQENITHLARTERRKDFVPMNFKDLVQTKAQEHNVVFVPVVGKRHEGRQLYTFGGIVVYIDRGVVFVQGEKTWAPTSLQSLLDMAK